MDSPDAQSEAVAARRRAPWLFSHSVSMPRLAGLVLWSIAVVAGTGFLIRYNSTPGQAPNGPRDWPSDTAMAGVALDERFPTLVMVAHPRCPCTRASLQEFGRLVAACRDRVSAHVVFFVPEPAGPDWLDSDLWRAARQLPGVKLHTDPAGRASRRLGTGTSGTVYVFAPGGEGLFAGGITASRGHEGDNAGRAAATRAVISGQVQDVGTPVFGCVIDDPAVAATPVAGAPD